MSLHVSLCYLHSYSDFSACLDARHLSTLCLSDKLWCVYMNSTIKATVNTLFIAAKEFKERMMRGHWSEHAHLLLVKARLDGYMH